MTQTFLVSLLYLHILISDRKTEKHAFYSSKCDKFHLLYQEQLRLPETVVGTLPFLNTALHLGAAEGNVTPTNASLFSHYHRQRSFAYRNELWHEATLAMNYCEFSSMDFMDKVMPVGDEQAEILWNSTHRFKLKFILI